jgi:uncharacterized membrane protein
MNDQNTGKERFWEIDFLRGIAIILMITLHLFDDISFLKMFHYQLNWTVWFFWQKITASLFLLLVGVSLALSRFYTEKSNLGKGYQRFKKYLKRGIGIFALGLVITFVTRFYLGEGFIIFGVLHFIGLATILSYPFLMFRYWNLIFGGTMIFIGSQLSHFKFSFPWLLWAGFMPSNFYSVDYFPVFPWFGVVLLGLFLGNTLYSQNGRRYKLYDFSRVPLIKNVNYLGQNSLVIYLIHQPLFMFILTMVHFLER